MLQDVEQREAMSTTFGDIPVSVNLKLALQRVGRSPEGSLVLSPLTSDPYGPVTKWVGDRVAAFDVKESVLYAWVGSHFVPRKPMYERLGASQRMVLLAVRADPGNTLRLYFVAYQGDNEQASF